MIIHSLCAENLLKYHRLELKDLPEQGLIAISGHNESGKSSIGECLCFALFGRSFAVDLEEVEKLIRWGDSRCSATLEFSAGDEQRYRITRMLDRDANHSAKLCRSQDPDQPLARGVDAVAEKVYDILGYYFDEFIESFYLAQREITTPHPHSYAVKIMAGIAPLEYCQSELEDELGKEQRAVEDAESRAADVDGQLERLAFDAGQLEGLEQDHATLAELDQDVAQRRESLHRASDEYREGEPRLRETESSRDTASSLRLSFLLLALLGLGMWGLLSQLPEAPVVKQMTELLAGSVPGWNVQHLTWILFAGVACVILFILFWARVASCNGRIRELHGAGERLHDEFGLVDGLESSLPDDIRDQTAAAEGVDELLETRLDARMRDQIGLRLREGIAGTQEVDRAVEREEGWMDATRRRLQQQLSDMNETLERERSRQDEYNKILGLKTAFERLTEEHSHRIKLREMADELLLGASRHLSYRFNHDLRGLVSKTLPLFTDQRYEHLQIEGDLSVRAFSNEKRDFMDLDEISSGTQRQIMLALRLALSQELVFRMVKGSQFLFLDEPFAFFDANRTRSSLKVLPSLSDEIRQIWVVAQAFPDEVDFDLHIHCNRETDSYVSDFQGR